MGTESFNAVEYINKNYSESTLYEINDMLITLSKSLSRTKHENKEMISAHFSKFVQCRAVLEDIWDDIKTKRLDKDVTSQIEKQIEMVNSKYQGISSMIGSDITAYSNQSKRAYYMNILEPIFKMKADLSRNLNSFENFVRIYKNCLKIFNEAKESKFLASKFEEIKPEIRMYLENVYNTISSKDISFEDACYHFDLYFSVSDEKRDRKIMNTLLVNFKESTYHKMDCSSEYFDFLFASLSKLIKYVDEDLAIEGISYFFQILAEVLSETNALFCKITINRVYALKSQIEWPASALKEFLGELDELKSFLFRRLVEGKGISAVVEIYNGLSEVFTDEDRKRIQEIIISHVKHTLESQETNSIQYLKTEAGEIKRIRPCLGPLNSKANKELDSFLKEYRNKAIEEIADNFHKTLKEENISESLMEAARILKDFPDHGRAIIFENKNEIVKNSILFHYLSKVLKMEPPTLSKVELRRVEELNKQFGFFVS